MKLEPQSAEATGVQEPTPKVSVGLPLRNGAEYLREALDSILAQSFHDFELVICDNASTDESFSICEEYAERDSRIRLYRNEENVGGAGNYNKVFELSRGEYFKWAAHDDICEETLLERCVAALDAKQLAVIAFPRTRYVDAAGGVQRVSTPGLSVRAHRPVDRVRRLIDLAIRDDDVYMSIFGLFRRDALARSARIATHVASDQTLLLELALQGDFEEVDEPLFVRRMHDETSMIRDRRPHAQARWFDPKHGRRVVMPVWGLWRAHNRVIRVSRLGFGGRWACYWHLTRRFLRRWPALLGEIKKAAFQLVGLR